MNDPKDLHYNGRVGMNYLINDKIRGRLADRGPDLVRDFGFVVVLCQGCAGKCERDSGSSNKRADHEGLQFVWSIFRALISHLRMKTM